MTVGGAIGGIHRDRQGRRARCPPASVITIERTEAKIGRSMKKRVNTVRARARVAGIESDHAPCRLTDRIAAGVCRRRARPRALPAAGLWPAGGRPARAAGRRECAESPASDFSAASSRGVASRRSLAAGRDRSSRRFGVERPGLHQVAAPW